MIQKKKQKWSLRKKLILLGLGVFLLISAVIALSGRGGEQDDELPRTPVVVEGVQRGDVIERVRLSGEIKGQNQADIYADVPGRLNQLYVREGQYVNRGQVVADIDRNIVGMVYRPATVTSPISGIIGRIYVDVGMTVAQNVPIMMVADTRTVEGILAVPEKYVPYFNVGQRAEVRLQSYPDEVFTGTISNKGSMIDPATRTLQVRIRLSNPGGKILPGNYADFSIQIREARDQVIVPFDAVIDTIERQMVFVVHEKDSMLEPDMEEDGPSMPVETEETDIDENGGDEQEAAAKFYRAELREIRLGIQDGNWVQVISGLEEGERVVTFGKENVIDQAWLRVISPRGTDAAGGAGVDPDAEDEDASGYQEESQPE